MTTERAEASLLQQNIEAHQEVLAGLAEAVRPDFARATTLLSKAFQRGRKLLVAGNGGCAAVGQHFTSSLVAGRGARAAIALTADASALTAIGLDYTFDDIFARQVRALGTRGDVVVLLASEGAPTNLVRAARQARERGIGVLALQDESSGPLTHASDVALCVPSRVPQRVQEMHALLLHALAASL
jgi:D-sedoheptulose 7-phosphate isomerase